MKHNTEEAKRMEAQRAGEADWRKWGPYLSERQWGTVREDYSENSDAWGYLPHDMARSRTYRWGEDGLMGISDAKQRLCFAIALWNEKDTILKERLFGLNGPEGNHGEDVKEVYYYLDNIPSHAWMHTAYKYPQEAFPYIEVRDTNAGRGKIGEYELVDTGIFDEDKYFDVDVFYAKAGPEDMFIRIVATNRGPDTAPLHLLPTLWFRNTWTWTSENPKPRMRKEGDAITIDHHKLPNMALYAPEGMPMLFCENETNRQRVFAEGPKRGYFKDGINDHVVDGKATINPAGYGTKASFHQVWDIPSGESRELILRLGPQGLEDPFADAASTLASRKAEADAFYADLQQPVSDPDARLVHRQALAGMLWTKQFFYFDVKTWLDGDPDVGDPPEQRKWGRNSEWRHLNNADIISMPDKWEYPWYAAWDLAFHCLPLALIDPEFAKEQLILFTREWYMHPNGQLPAYEWNFSDVNPPVHAWACWKVYQMEQQYYGRKDRAFLEHSFHKLLLNFTWWVNRKDHEGNNIFQGGFLGLDNIGVFDRSKELPTGGNLEQADGTSWMAMYSLNMMRMALELAQDNPVYENTATKFFEHFLYIAGAMVNVGNKGISLWDEEDEFFYDVLNLPDDEKVMLKVRSLVGLAPLFAVEVLDHALLEKVPEFTQRMDWFLDYRSDLAQLVSRWKEYGKLDTHLLSLLRGHRFKRLMRRMLDETEFLSPYGIRGMSKQHEATPYVLTMNKRSYSVAYSPAESDSDMFGGNSNWRGPVWFPMNYLLIDSMRSFHKYFGDDFVVEYPTGSGRVFNIREIADALAHRLTRLFLRGEDGNRPVFGDAEKFQEDPHFRDNILFYEYFHGDNGRGVGASHQTGWTGLVANLIQELYEFQADQAEGK